MTRINRESNIELLRILATLGVVIMHYNAPSIGGGLVYAEKNIFTFYSFQVLSFLFIGAVDCFCLISGYFLINSSKRSIIKCLELFFITSAFQIVCYCVRVFWGGVKFNIIKFVGCFVPANWYISIYVALFLVSPYIGETMKQLSLVQLKRMVVLFVFVISVWPWIVDMIGAVFEINMAASNPIGMNGDGAGRTLIVFILMWVIGAAIKIYEEKNYEYHSKLLDMNSVSYFLGYLVFTVIILLLFIMGEDDISSQSVIQEAVNNYGNPFVVGQAFFAFMAFNRINIRQNSVINELAGATIFVYIIHSSLLRFLKIEYFASERTPIACIHIIGSACCIYLLGYIVRKVYLFITNPIWRWIRKVLNNIGIEKLETL